LQRQNASRPPSVLPNPMYSIIGVNDLDVDDDMALEHNDTHREVIIVGSGPSGILSALKLRELGINPLILERNSCVAGNWSSRIPERYMTTPFSTLRIRKRDLHRRWITGSEYWRYLERVATEEKLDIQLDWEVGLIKRGKNNWKIESPRGEVSCSVLIIATGQDDKRRSPPKSDGTVRVVHSSEFAKQHHQLDNALVVGLGTSGADIAAVLAKKTGIVSVAHRSIPVILPKTILGLPVTKLGYLAHLFPDGAIDLVGDAISAQAFGRLLWKHDAPRHRLSERRTRRYAPVIDDGFVEQMVRGRIRLRPGLAELTNGQAVFEDGSSLKPSVVIDATGYEESYQRLFGNDTQLDYQSISLAPELFPKHCSTLFTVGIRQHTNVFASFVQSDARRVAINVARQLQTDSLSSIPKPSHFT